MSVVEQGKATRTERKGAGGSPVPGAPLLEIRDLHVEFRTREGIARAVRGASYTVGEGETLAVLGESGSGKSVTAQALMGILETPPGFVTSGQVLYRGQDILSWSSEERRQFRAEKIAMIFQDALSSLNPTYTVGWQIAELFRVHAGCARRRRTSAPSSSCTASRSPPPRNASTTTRTSSPAGCVSAS